MTHISQRRRFQSLLRCRRLHGPQSHVRAIGTRSRAPGQRSQCWCTTGLRIDQRESQHDGQLGDVCGRDVEEISLDASLSHLGPVLARVVAEGVRCARSRSACPDFDHTLALVLGVTSSCSLLSSCDSLSLTPPHSHSPPHSHPSSQPPHSPQGC